MDNYDITNDGVLDLIVARDDGAIEIYGYDETDEPVLKYSHVRSRGLFSKNFRAIFYDVFLFVAM